jgi:hypothetical protein
MATGSTWSLFKLSVMNMEVKATEIDVCGLRAVGWSLLFKGKDLHILAFTYISKTTVVMTFQGKMQKRWIASRSCQESEHLSSSQENSNGLAWVWLICNWICINLKKVSEKSLEIMVSFRVPWRFNCPSRCYVSRKKCSVSWVPGGGWWRVTVICWRKSNFLFFWSGIVTWYDAY